MRPGLLAFRALVAVLLILFGVAIVVRGITSSVPFTFTLVGALMIALGAYRLRLIYSATTGRR